MGCASDWSRWGLGGLAAILTLFAVQDLTALVKGLRAYTPVTVYSASAATLAIVPMLAVLAAIAFRRLGAGNSAAWDKRAFSGVVYALPLLLILPVGLNIWASSALPDQGYRRCPSVGHPGLMPRQLWTPVTTPCPAVYVMPPVRSVEGAKL